VNDELATEI